MPAQTASGVYFDEKEAVFQRINAAADLVFGITGVTERGPLDKAPTVTSFAEWVAVYGGYTLASLAMAGSARAYFDNGGTRLRTARITHFTTQGDPSTTTAAKGATTLLTAAASPSAGYTESNVQPFDLSHNDTIVVAFETGGDQTFTITATSPSRVSGSETFSLSNGQTFIIAINGGAFKTKTFSTFEFVSISAATAEEVTFSLNAFFAANELPCVATVTGGGTTVTITVNRKGTGAIINISASSTATGLGFTTGALAGTGNVSNVDAVTAAEIATIAAAITNGTVSSAGGRVRFTSGTTGVSSSAQVKSASTADDEMGFDNAVHNGSDGTPANTWTFTGKTHGAYTDALTIAITDPSNGDALSKDVEIRKNGLRVEKFQSLSADPTSDRFVEDIINADGTGSNLLVVDDLGLGLPPANGVSSALTGGGDGLVGLTDNDFLGAVFGDTATGLHLFNKYDDVTDIALPGRATSAVQNGAITYAAVHKENGIFAFLDPPQDLSAEEMREYVLDTASLKDLTVSASIYWPELRVLNPDADIFGENETVVIPPCGVVAGIAARIQQAKVGGAFDQPAGPDIRYLPRNVLGFATVDELPPTLADRQRLFPVNVNPVTKEEGSPVFVDGARTLSIAGNWPSVGQSRGVMYVRRKLREGLNPLRHRNITDELLRKGVRTITSFLTLLAREGALKSKDPTKAFFVDGGPALNPPSAAQQRQIVFEVGLATGEPAEFVIVRYGPDTRAIDEEAAQEA